MTLILEKPGKRSARPVLLIILAFWSASRRGQRRRTAF